MTSFDELDKQIDEKLGAQNERSVQYHHLVAERMRQHEEHQQRYTAISDRLVQEIIRPRMERLARRFDNAQLLCDRHAECYKCGCSFLRTPQYPATVKLEIGINCDHEFQNVSVRYELSIMPIFLQFEGKDELTLSMDHVDEEHVAAWVEEKLLGFVDTYLQLESVDQYQSENLVIDPVCGMRINQLYAEGQMQYEGRSYFFCVPECKEKFAADPQKYAGAGGNL
jgi:YHS domain-containing protein